MKAIIREGRKEQDRLNVNCLYSEMDLARKQLAWVLFFDQNVCRAKSHYEKEQDKERILFWLPFFSAGLN